MNRYEDAIPVTQEWVDEHEDEQWTFTMFVFLDDIIEADGIEGMNELADEAIGISLVDLGYKVVQVDPETVDGTIVCIEVTGTIDEQSDLTATRIIT